MSNFVNEEEEKHWQDVKRTMLKYSNFVNYDLQTRQDHLNRLSEKNVARLPNATFQKLGAISHAARNNQVLLDSMVKFHSEEEDKDGKVKINIPDKNKGKPIDSNQQHRNNAILHSVYREWSEEGKEERASSFDILLDELLTRLPVTSNNAYKYRVLTPGCGLGRLPLEVAAKGYKCQGNEFSAFMAIASHFMLNACADPKYFDIHPWLEKVCNVVNIQDTLQCCQVSNQLKF
jgi:carnosine N-methyltransferase